MKKYEDMIKDMEESVTQFFNHFQDTPGLLSGWGHNYFCEVDGEKLTFKQSSPRIHKCGICDYEYTGEKYDDSWVYLNRLQSFFEIVKAAYFYKQTDNEAYLNHARKTLLYYAENYAKFQLHAKDKIITSDLTVDVGGAGKIMPQGLNEGYMLIKIIQALDILGDSLSVEERLMIKEQLIRPAIEEVLAPQLIRIHNIVCWIACGIAAAGFHFDEQKWIDYAFVGEFKIANQLKDGVTKNHLWYEGSIHYHFFMLEAVLNLMVYQEAMALMADEKAIVKKMLIGAYEYAFDNSIFPNPNDGWPNINLKTYLHVYHMAAKVFKGCNDILDIIATIEASEVKRMPIPLGEPYYYGDWPLEKLLFNSESKAKALESKRKSYLFGDSNFAMLRNDRINLFMKFGHNDPSHAHPDKMTFELTIDDKLITRDLSNAGYGADICNEWHRMSASHNTVVVDGKNHDNVAPGRTLSFTEASVSAECVEIYPGVDFSREFELSATTIQDVFSVTSAEEHVYDYFLHIDETIKPVGGKSVKGTLGFEENGYQHIKNVKKVTGTKKFKILVKGVTAEITVDTDAEIFICETLDNPVNKCRQTIVLRKKGKNVDFTATWKL